MLSGDAYSGNKGDRAGQREKMILSVVVNEVSVIYSKFWTGSGPSRHDGWVFGAPLQPVLGGSFLQRQAIFSEVSAEIHQ